MTLRTRTVLSLAPPGLPLAGLGVAGFLLLGRMGGRSDASLRENYESAQALFRINRGDVGAGRGEGRGAARTAVVAVGGGLGVVALLGVGVGWYLLRTILGPIVAVTEAVHAIGTSGQLDRTVPVFGRDELGRLA